MGFTSVAVNSSPGYIVDPSSIERTNGKQIDWDTVASSFAGSDGVKRIPGGTIMAKLASGKVIPVVGSDADGTGTGTAPNDATEILLESQSQDSKVTSLSGVATIRGGILYNELLPDYSDGNFATMKTALASAGCTFKYESYNNDNAS